MPVKQQQLYGIRIFVVTLNFCVLYNSQYPGTSLTLFPFGREVGLTPKRFVQSVHTITSKRYVSRSTYTFLLDFFFKKPVTDFHGWVYRVDAARSLNCCIQIVGDEELSEIRLPNPYNENIIPSGEIDPNNLFKSFKLS